MKKIFSNLIICMMMAFIFYGGSGINIFSFCCNACRAVGIELVAEKGCYNIEESAHEDTSCCSNKTPVEKASDSCCNLKRVDFDWLSQQASTISFTPVVCDLLSIALPDFLSVNAPALDDINWIQSHAPPSPCPRTYLSKLTVLLI